MRGGEKLGIFAKKGYDYDSLAKKLSVLFSKKNSPNNFYLSLLQFFCDALGSQRGTLVLKEGERFIPRQSLKEENFSFRMEECIPFIEWLKKYKEPISRQQLLSEPKFATLKKMGLHFFIQFQAEICIPLFIEERLAGFITLSSKQEGKPYTEACRNLCNWIAVQVALSLQNTRMMDESRYHQVEVDAAKELKNQIISNLSHEFKTPLTGVIGFAELLAEEIDGPLNPEQKNHIERVLEGAQRLLKVLTALVDLAKLETGHLPLNVQQFHLEPLVASLSEELPFSSDTAFKVSLTGDTPRIYGDLTHVRQIFKQILDNAAKYTPQGFVEVTAGKKGEMLEVCVADSGIGIAEDKLGKIFENFYQVDGGLSRRFEGSGVGLTLSKKLVELHGGRLWVESAPGLGSRFFFTLPLKPIVIKHRELAA